VFLRPIWLRQQQIELFNKNLPLEYRYLANKISLTEFPTGMKWVHLDDEQTSTIDCGIQVQAGSFDETRLANTYDGTAHLLEHSVFLDQTTQDRSLFSYWNAFTDEQQTQYHFSTTPANAENGLKVSFKSLFNFKENPKTRDEINAVQSE
jgi:predicted Zn-dependent peptidase